MQHLSFNQIVVNVMVLFMILGVFDKITKKRFNLGLADEFDAGFQALGHLALSMLGILSLAPVLTKGLIFVFGPIYNFIGADPAMMAGTFLAMDMGAYSVAHSMTTSKEVADFSSLILGGMMGTTLVFTIPVAISILNKKDFMYLSEGILYGMITIPIGCIAGGLAAGYDLKMILVNLIPVVGMSILIIVGLKLVPVKMIKGFRIFGDLVTAMITIALMAGIVEMLTGIVIIPGMAPLSDGFGVIGHIAIVLAGAYPMVSFITKKVKKPLQSLGVAIGINKQSVAGLVASTANNIPMLGMYKNMNERGKIINAAFVVSGTFIIGDDLAFTASVDKSMIFPMIFGKAVGGITAAMVAWAATKERADSDEINYFSKNRNTPSKKRYLTTQFTLPLMVSRDFEKGFPNTKGNCVQKQKID
jgi:ethanolamine transporter